MSVDRLVYMANQIGKSFAHEGPDRAVTSIAEHLRLYWVPRMRADLIAHGRSNGGSDLEPLVWRALQTLPMPSIEPLPAGSHQ